MWCLVLCVPDEDHQAGARTVFPENGHFSNKSGQTNTFSQNDQKYQTGRILCLFESPGMMDSNALQLIAVDLSTRSVTTLLHQRFAVDQHAVEGEQAHIHLEQVHY